MSAGAAASTNAIGRLFVGRRTAEINNTTQSDYGVLFNRRLLAIYDSKS